MDGHPHRGMKRFTRMFAVPSAVNSAVVTANMFARWLKRSVKRFYTTVLNEWFYTAGFVVRFYSDEL